MQKKEGCSSSRSMSYGSQTFIYRASYSRKCNHGTYSKQGPSGRAPVRRHINVQNLCSETHTCTRTHKDTHVVNPYSTLFQPLCTELGLLNTLHHPTVQSNRSSGVVCVCMFNAQASSPLNQHSVQDQPALPAERPAPLIYKYRAADL
ncbi:unnamed protein product [Boreogadus saida]